jgi:hypothetical protein
VTSCSCAGSRDQTRHDLRQTVTLASRSRNRRQLAMIGRAASGARRFESLERSARANHALSCSGRSIPLSACAPRSSTTNSRGTSRCVASLIATVPGSVAVSSRAAILRITEHLSSAKTQRPSGRAVQEAVLVVKSVQYRTRHHVAGLVEAMPLTLHLRVAMQARNRKAGS